MLVRPVTGIALLFYFYLSIGHSLNWLMKFAENSLPYFVHGNQVLIQVLVGSSIMACRFNSSGRERERDGYSGTSPVCSRRTETVSTKYWVRESDRITNYFHLHKNIFFFWLERGFKIDYKERTFWVRLECPISFKALVAVPKLPK
jgi:hypothetical protein